MLPFLIHFTHKRTVEAFLLHTQRHAELIHFVCLCIPKRKESSLTKQEGFEKKIDVALPVGPGEGRWGWWGWFWESDVER